MKNNDELLNKYIDNELNKEELNKVENLIKSDNQFKTELSVHKYVHESLLDYSARTAPAGITESIMNKILSGIGEKYKKNHLFTFVITVLSSIFILILFLFFYLIGDLTLFNKVSSVTLNFSDNLIPSFSSVKEILNSNVFKTITGLLSFIVLIIFYFNYNSHKDIKDTLKNL